MENIFSFKLKYKIYFKVYFRGKKYISNLTVAYDLFIIYFSFKCVIYSHV